MNGQEPNQAQPASTANEPQCSIEPRPANPGNCGWEQPWATFAPLKPRWVVLLAVAAITAFHLGFLFAPLSWLVLVWLGCLFALRRVSCGRWAFYTGLAIGLGIYGPQLSFFWEIFGPAAIALWLVLAFWLALFLLLLHGVERYWGTRCALALAPVLWLGIEFFRSELYYLRFSWFTAGSFLPPAAWSDTYATLGVYGVGAALMLVSALVFVAIEGCLSKQWNWVRPLAWTVGVVVLASLVAPFFKKAEARSGPPHIVYLAGVQLEFPKEAEVIENLDRVIRVYPHADLVMLGEYTFDGPPPDTTRDWCRRNGRWLVAGGKEPIEGGGFYNTAFVVSPEGDIAFKQAKSVPIQFFNDGTPARQQGVWRWIRSETLDGQIQRPLTHLEPERRLIAGFPIQVGLAICYDLSFALVMDRLISRHQPELLLVPAMDAENWGRHQHWLNARMTAIRAAEYRLAIFRVATSGYSQLVGRGGNLLQQAGVPGQGEIIAGELRWTGLQRPRVPMDRGFGFLAVVATAVIVVWLGVEQRRSRRRASTATAGELPTPNF